MDEATPLPFALRARHVVTPDGVRPATVRVEGGRIVDVLAFEASGDASDLGEAWLLPGLVDTHVHINEPGRTEWEGFATATRAAAAGGITTLVDMPLNSVPATTSAAGLDAKVGAARGQCHVDVALWGGVVPGNGSALQSLATGGVRGFKCFLSPSGVDEFGHVGEHDLREAAPVLAALGLPLLAHAESPAVLDRVPQPAGDRRTHSKWEASRPPEAEADAIAMLARVVRDTGVAVHVVHVASAEAVDAVRGSRVTGTWLGAETCPHYLVFDAGAIPAGATEFKCAPPLRANPRHRDALWAALEDGTLDLIASDHSPCPPAMKARESGDFFAAWGGIASLECGLAAVWTEWSRRRQERPQTERVRDVVRWMAEGPARLAGFAHKGRITVGADADLIAWRPGARWTVDPARLHQRHPLTPYAGRALLGVVDTTWVGGVRVFDRGRFAPPAGRLRLEPRERVG